MQENAAKIAVPAILAAVLGRSLTRPVFQIGNKTAQISLRPSLFSSSHSVPGWSVLNDRLS